MKREKGVTLLSPHLHNIKQNAEYLPNNQQQSSPTLILNQVKNKSTEQVQYHFYF